MISKISGTLGTGLIKASSTVISTQNKSLTSTSKYGFTVTAGVKFGRVAAQNKSSKLIYQSSLETQKAFSTLLGVEKIVSKEVQELVQVIKKKFGDKVEIKIEDNRIDFILKEIPGITLSIMTGFCDKLLKQHLLIRGDKRSIEALIAKGKFDSRSGTSGSISGHIKGEICFLSASPGDILSYFPWLLFGEGSSAILSFHAFSNSFVMFSPRICPLTTLKDQLALYRGEAESLCMSSSFQQNTHGNYYQSKSLHEVFALKSRLSGVELLSLDNNEEKKLITLYNPMVAPEKDLDTFRSADSKYYKNISSMEANNLFENRITEMVQHEIGTNDSTSLSVIVNEQDINPESIGCDLAAKKISEVAATITSTINEFRA